MLYHSITERIGRTPMVALTRVGAALGAGADVFAKLEYQNPAGSVKDRIAAAMIHEAEVQGRLRPGTRIIEPTSGNTGIGLAAVCAARGYRLVIVMPESMSEERQRILRAYGAELVLTPHADGMRGALMTAYAMAQGDPNSFIPSQFTNPANPACHRQTTGPEICEDMDGRVDVFVAGVGTGGTISGVGEYLKYRCPGVTVVAVEPEGSAVLTHGIAGQHGIQGIGPGFVPDTLNTEIYDSVMTVRDEEAAAMCRLLARTEGMLVGLSSGAAAHAAFRLARQAQFQGQRIVTVFPDSGERYLSTGIFEQDAT